MDRSRDPAVIFHLVLRRLRDGRCLPHRLHRQWARLPHRAHALVGRVSESVTRRLLIRERRITLALIRPTAMRNKHLNLVPLAPEGAEQSAEHENDREDDGKGDEAAFKHCRVLSDFEAASLSNQNIEGLCSAFAANGR